MLLPKCKCCGGSGGGGGVCCENTTGISYKVAAKFIPEATSTVQEGDIYSLADGGPKFTFSEFKTPLGFVHNQAREIDSLEFYDIKLDPRRTLEASLQVPGSGYYVPFTKPQGYITWQSEYDSGTNPLNYECQTPAIYAGTGYSFSVYGFDPECAEPLGMPCYDQDGNRYASRADGRIMFMFRDSALWAEASVRGIGGIGSSIKEGDFTIDYASFGGETVYHPRPRFLLQNDYGLGGTPSVGWSNTYISPEAWLGPITVGFTLRIAIPCNFYTLYGYDPQGCQDYDGNQLGQWAWYSVSGEATLHWPDAVEAFPAEKCLTGCCDDYGGSSPTALFARKAAYTNQSRFYGPDEGGPSITGSYNSPPYTIYPNQARYGEGLVYPASLHPNDYVYKERIRYEHGFSSSPDGSICRGARIKWFTGRTDGIAVIHNEAGWGKTTVYPTLDIDLDAYELLISYGVDCQGWYCGTASPPEQDLRPYINNIVTTFGGKTFLGNHAKFKRSKAFPGYETVGPENWAGPIGVSFDLRYVVSIWGYDITWSSTPYNLLISWDDMLKDEAFEFCADKSNPLP